MSQSRLLGILALVAQVGNMAALALHNNKIATIVIAAILAAVQAATGRIQGVDRP